MADVGKAVKAPKVDKKAAKAARRAQTVASRPNAPTESPTHESPRPPHLSRPSISGSSSSHPLPHPQGALTPSTSTNSASSSATQRPSPLASAPATNRPPAVLPTPAQPLAPQPHMIVSHLPGPKPSGSVAATIKGDVHPAVITLGLMLKEGKIRGANARLVAGLEALKQVCFLLAVDSLWPSFLYSPSFVGWCWLTFAHLVLSPAGYPLVHHPSLDHPP